jgi:ubiquinone/menaquinone biosynthesis C-methylase UbiE
MTVMSFYRDRVFLPLMNRALDDDEHRRIRSEVCAPLAGEVVEIGFGTGLNLPHLPAAVTRLYAVDPLERGQVKAADRLAASPVPVDFVGLDGQSLPLDDDSVDAALSTWTLCSVPDPVAAVRELHRVLRPGGTLHFAEHGLSPDAAVQRWQRRLNGLQQRLAGGCHLNRDMPSIVTAAGFQIDRLRTFQVKGQPKVVGWTFEGTAQA